MGMGFNPTNVGRHFSVPKEFPKWIMDRLPKKYNKMSIMDRLDELDKINMIHWPTKKGGAPRIKKYLKDARGIPLQDIFK